MQIVMSLRTAGHRAVDHGDVGARQRLRIFAQRRDLLAQRRIAEIGDIDLVDLQIAAAGGGEVAHLLAVDAREVGIELRHVRIGLPVDRRAAAAEVHVARRRDGQLRRHLGHRLHELEMIDKDRVRPGELAGDLQGLAANIRPGPARSGTAP